MLICAKSHPTDYGQQFGYSEIYISRVCWQWRYNWGNFTGFEAISCENVNKIIIDDLNINFFAVISDAIKTIIPGNVDIMIFSESKLDVSYPVAQLLIVGFRSSFRLERNSFGGGLLIYVRSDIPCKLVNDHSFSDNIEGIFFYRNQFFGSQSCSYVASTAALPPRCKFLFQ